jgi:peptide/nickel transport system substrate-binding protein
MNKRTSTALAATVVAALALASAGCSGGKQRSSGRKAATANVGAVLGGTPHKGCTLTVLSNQDFTHLDPARNWVMTDMEFGTRLLYRTLVTYKAAPGAAGSELVPDLATDLGSPSNGARTWTFHLRPGVKYEDGSPVTAQDVKYNVERSFSPELPGGADYADRYLAGAQGYELMHASAPCPPRSASWCSHRGPRRRGPRTRRQPPLVPPCPGLAPRRPAHRARR